MLKSCHADSHFRGFSLGLLRNRNCILLLALTFGLLLPQAAPLTKRITLPALAVVMTLSIMGVRGGVFRNPRSLMPPLLLGILMNYLVQGGIILWMTSILISDEPTRNGFVILAAVPPAVAIIPFTEFLRGNTTYSLVGTVGGYLAALFIMPLLALLFLDSVPLDPLRIVAIVAELIALPLVLSRFLIWRGVDKRLGPIKGTITNWGFFLVVYTVVGLNQGVFVHEPVRLIPVAFIAIAVTFLLGTLIGWAGRFFQIDPEIRMSMMLLGTQKNCGLAAGIALTLFNEETALPATVATIFVIVYVIWLGLIRGRKE